MLWRIMHDFMIFWSVSRWKNRVGPRIIAKHAWSTPNARSTSFLYASWACTNNFHLCPCRAGIVFTNVVHFGYILSAKYIKAYISHYKIHKSLNYIQNAIKPINYVNFVLPWFPLGVWTWTVKMGSVMGLLWMNGEYIFAIFLGKYFLNKF